MTASSATGARQLGVGTSRVRAGAPQARHQAWSGPIVVAQRGQAMVPGAGGAPGGATLTARGARRSAGPRPRAWPSARVFDRAHDLRRLLTVGGRRIGGRRDGGRLGRGGLGLRRGRLRLRLRRQRLQLQRGRREGLRGGGWRARRRRDGTDLPDGQAHGLADLGDRARPAHRRSARRAEAGLAAVQRPAARAHRDAGLAQLGERPPVVERDARARAARRRRPPARRACRARAPR